MKKPDTYFEAFVDRISWFSGEDKGREGAAMCLYSKGGVMEVEGG